MSSDAAAPSIITVNDLKVHYPIGGSLFGERRVVKALDGISIDIPKGCFFGLVGESGSGKTTLGRAILKAAPITDGEIRFNDGEMDASIGALKGAELKSYRRRAQLIFQDPYAALSPRMTVRDIIAEPLEVMKITATRQATDTRVREIAHQCRLNTEHLRRFPHAFSGGQRQRISIARALVSNPSFVVADESVAALDVSIQADILNLLRGLQRDLGLTFLFISHDLSVIAHTCDIVAVMYLGRIVEMAPKRKLFAMPRHPYTQALFPRSRRLTRPHANPPSSLKARSRARATRRPVARSIPDAALRRTAARLKPPCFLRAMTITAWPAISTRISQMASSLLTARYRRAHPAFRAVPDARPGHPAPASCWSVTVPRATFEATAAAEHTRQEPRHTASHQPRYSAHSDRWRDRKAPAQAREMHVFEPLIPDNIQRAFVWLKPQFLLIERRLDIAEIKLPVNLPAPPVRLPAAQPWR